METESSSEPASNPYPGEVKLGTKEEGYEAEIERSVKRLDITEKATLFVLPSNVDSIMREELVGPFVLQVDNIIKTRPPLNRNYIFMTDGDGGRAVGMEDMRIEDLRPLPPPPAHLTIVVSNVQVELGVLMLTPASVKVFKEGQKIVVEKVNEPPTGKRTASPAGTMADADVSCVVVDFEPPSMPRPLTYFAELSQKLARSKSNSTVQGRIKCFVTGVKQFTFSYESEWKYEAECSVHDCCFNYEILLCDDLIRKHIGCPAKDVATANYSSSAEKNLLNEKVRNFQSFLTLFRGVMVVEMSTSSQYPVAIELESSC